MTKKDLTIWEHSFDDSNPDSHLHYIQTEVIDAINSKGTMSVQIDGLLHTQKVAIAEHLFEKITQGGMSKTDLEGEITELFNSTIAITLKHIDSVCASESIYDIVRLQDFITTAIDQITED